MGLIAVWLWSAAYIAVDPVERQSWAYQLYNKMHDRCSMYYTISGKRTKTAPLYGDQDKLKNYSPIIMYLGELTRHLVKSCAGGLIFYLFHEHTYLKKSN